MKGVEVVDAVMLLVGPLRRKLEGLTETSRMMWFLGTAAVALLGAGVTAGIGWANWQGLPSEVEAAQDSAAALRADLENHLLNTTQPALRDLEAVGARQESIAAGVAQLNVKMDHLENLVLRGLCRQMNEPVASCELRIYGSDGP